MALPRLHVVYDCNVFWRAFFSRRGIGHECKKQIDDGTVINYVSAEIVKELSDVLSRPETLAAFPLYTIDEINDFVKEIVTLSTFVRRVTHLIDLPRDIKDEPYLNLALNVSADFIVTTDRDLLDLMTGIDIASKTFRQKYRHLRIVSPRRFLETVFSRKLSLGP